MDNLAILAAIDEALETTLPEGIRAMAEGDKLHAICLHLDGWEDHYQGQHDYNGVTIKRSLAPLGPDGWAVRILPGFERPPA